jgi:magnesium chelatase subunit I
VDHRSTTAALPPHPPADLPASLGALRASGHQHRSVKDELRDNLVARLRDGLDPLPGIVGFDDTVRPEVERALLAGHDFVLLGERGQGKTRLIRTLVGLLDEWVPVLAGTEINEHPYAPITPWGRRQVAEHGAETPIGWLHRSLRYGEKLATPDTSVGDLIGDVDPIKVAEGRSLGDPETVHYGLVPRTNRGIFAVNELPDLAERIQVSLLNVLEERDVQVRGYQLRLPLDLLLVASANPEDYTNRGRIITPLKDRFGAEIRTHYPLELADEVALVEQEARLAALVPRHLLEVLARFTRMVRESPAVDQRSGVSARFAVAGAETAAASALRRAAITGDDPAVARVCDLMAVAPALRGKVEFEVGEEGREYEVLEHLLRRAVAEEFRERLGGADLDALVARFDDSGSVVSGELVPAAVLLSEAGPVEGLGRIMAALGLEPSVEVPGFAASALEFALEGLWLTRRIGKDDVGGRVRYTAG